jgi:holo-[acyl-carrier protein] synthase
MSSTLSRLAHGALGTLLPDSDLRGGVDVVDLAQFRRDLGVGGKRFLRRIYTQSELAHCDGREEKLAARFAAKEAVAKALGTGIRGIGWQEIEIVSGTNGEPRVLLHGRARDRAAALGLASWSLSLTHSASVALAMVVARSVELAEGVAGQGGGSNGK